MAEILHQLRLVVQICRDCCTSFLRYLLQFLCVAQLFQWFKSGDEREGDVVQTDVAWLKNADRKIPRRGLAVLGPHRNQGLQETSDEVGNWKRDSEISLIWPWFHSSRAHQRVLVLEPGEKHQKTTQMYIYIYYHILSIVARYSWCHVTTKSHDVITWFYCTCFCEGRFKRFNWPGLWLWWQQADSHVEVCHVELAKHPWDNPPGPVHWTSLLSVFSILRLTWIDMDSLIVSPCILICIEFLYFVEADLCKHIVYCNIIQVVILLIPVHLYLWYVLVQSDAFFFGLERGLRCKVFITPLDPNHKSDLVKDCIQVIQLIDRFKRRKLSPSTSLLRDTWTCPWCPWTCHSVWKGRPSTQCSGSFYSTETYRQQTFPSLQSICRSNFHEFDNVNRVHSTA